MIVFDIVDCMPGHTSSKNVIKHVKVRASIYYFGYVTCKCGVQSPESDDPMEPFRWLGRHQCQI